MSFLSFAKKQFIDILQWTESSDDVLAWRFPTADFEIQQGAQPIVRETQAAPGKARSRWRSRRGHVWR